LFDERKTSVSHVVQNGKAFCHSKNGFTNKSKASQALKGFCSLNYENPRVPEGGLEPPRP
jgi:hypothetical protein